MTQAFQTVAKFTQHWQKIIFLHVLALSKYVTPSLLADSKDQENFSCIMFSFSVFLKDPIDSTEVFLLLSFKPEIDLNASKILMSTWNDLKELSSANVASFANIVLLNSLSNISIPWNPYFLLQLAVRCIKYIDKLTNGQPCREPFLILKKSVICPELMNEQS